MKENKSAYLDLFRHWKSINLNEKQIREELSLIGYDEKELNEIFTKYIEMQQKERLSQGFILIISGALLGFISCVLTILDLFPEARNFFIYGLTSISVIIAMIGGYLVFERN